MLEEGKIAEFKPVVVSNRPKRPYWIKPVLVFFVTAILAVGGYFGYQYYLKNAAKKMFKAESVGIINDQNIAFATISKDQKSLLFLDQIDNTLRELKIDFPDKPSEKIATLDFTPNLTEITNVKWAADNWQKFYIFVNIPGSSQIYYWDMTSVDAGDYRAVDKKIVDIDFGGERAFYIYNSESERSINTGNLDGTSWRNLTTIGTQYYNILSSPDYKRVAVWGMAAEPGQKNIAIFDTPTNEFREIDDGLINFARFSPDSSRLLYSKTVDGNSKLFMVESNGGIKDLNSEVYFDLFSWRGNNDIVYVGYNAKVKTYDFYTMSMADKKKKVINRAEGELTDPKILIITSDGKNLFYTNNSELFKLAL